MATDHIAPVVSVVMITYGHEKFIREAIEGVLKQETEFQIELIVADDHSPDSTRKVVENILNVHPQGHLVNYTRHGQNKGMMPNFIWALKQATGKYIALCEGDDYWTSSHKLQTQFNYMESHPNCAFCFHKVKELGADGLHEDKLNVQHKEQFHLKEILTKNYAHTPSILLRAEQLTIPPFFYSAMPGDHTLQCILLRNGGYAFYMKEAMAVYRKHEGGVWSSDRGRSHLVARAVTKLKLYDFLGITNKRLITTQFYMLADGIVRDGYTDISYFAYRRLLWKSLGFKGIALLGYISFPKVYHKLRSIVKKEDA